MASLYQRATPAQRRILRIIEGSIKNACDAHPHQRIDAKFARSISKRAAGTISAQWPELLAAEMPSDSADGLSLAKAPPSASPQLQGTPRRGAAQFLSRTPRSPFKMLYRRLGAMAGWARKAGHESRAAAFADALRVIDSVEAELRDNR
jgi:hypothetical protein